MNTNDNFRTVKIIADELNAIVRGDMYVCPECGEIIDAYTESEDGDGYTVYACKCGCKSYTEPEIMTLYDHDCVCDPFDIEYRVDARLVYRSVKIMVACGGPNIFINTATGQVELYWWGERAEYPLATATVNAIDDIYSEYYNCR